MKEFGIVVDASTVRFERLLDGPIERVWDYLTKREFLTTWLADGDIGRVGTPIALKQDGAKVPFRTGATIAGVVKRCEPPNVLSYTWNHIAPGAVNATIAESLVTIELVSRGDKVRMTLTHSGLTPAFVARLSTGWHSFLDILAVRMRGAEPESIQQMFARLLPLYESLILGP